MSHMPLATSAAAGKCFEGDHRGKKDARGARGASVGGGGVGIQSFVGLTSSLAFAGVLSHRKLGVLSHRKFSLLTLCILHAHFFDLRASLLIF